MTLRLSFSFPFFFMAMRWAGCITYFGGVAVHVSRFNVCPVDSLDASELRIGSVNWKFPYTKLNSCAIHVFNRGLVGLTKYDLRKHAFGQR